LTEFFYLLMALIVCIPDRNAPIFNHFIPFNSGRSGDDIRNSDARIGILLEVEEFLVILMALPF